MVNLLKEWNIRENDMLVSFDVVSPFTKILIDEVVDIIRCVSNDETANLVKVYLNSTYFNLWGDIYKQTKGVAMGSPPSLVVANLFIENFEETTLDSSSHKPKWWFRLLTMFMVIGHMEEIDLKTSQTISIVI